MDLEVNPAKYHLIDVKNWLSQEWKEKNEGFFCNWRIIERAYEENQILVGVDDRETIAFLIYSIVGEKIIFDIIEVKPSHRKLGLGTQFLKSCIEYLRLKMILKIEVDCINETSENLCKKLGFIKDTNPVVVSKNNYCLFI